MADDDADGSDRDDETRPRFRARAAGRDAVDPSLLRPDQPAPFLVQSGDDFVTLGLALELYHAVARVGGTGWKPSEVDRLRRRIRTRFDKNQVQHLEFETRRAIAWLERLGDAPEVEDEPGPLRFSPGPHAALVADALATERDLVLEFIGRDELTFHQVRVRPEALEREDDDAVVRGRRVPDGEEIAVELVRVRWLLVAERLCDLPARRTLAEVKRFPFGGRSSE